MITSDHGVEWVKSPLTAEKGIQIFSQVDAYVANYQRIAGDHIKQITTASNNPFIPDELWQELEESTRHLLLKYCKPGARILDAGVGLGRLVENLPDFQRYGIDISLDYLEIAKSKGIHVAFSKIEDMPFASDSFELVVAADVLEHVTDLNRCTSELLRVLKPDGILLIRVPYKEDLVPYLAKDLPYAFIHLRAFDEASLRLHFCKIFGLRFLEATMAAPFLQGASRLKFRCPTNAERENLKLLRTELGLEHEVVDALLSMSSEQITSWLYELRDNRRDVYRALKDFFLLPMDINIVFRK